MSPQTFAFATAQLACLLWTDKHWELGTCVSFCDPPSLLCKSRNSDRYGTFSGSKLKTNVSSFSCLLNKMSLISCLWNWTVHTDPWLVSNLDHYETSLLSKHSDFSLLPGVFSKQAWIQKYWFILLRAYFRLTSDGQTFGESCFNVIGEFCGL